MTLSTFVQKIQKIPLSGSCEKRQTDDGQMDNQITERMDKHKDGISQVLLYEGPINNILHG